MHLQYGIEACLFQGHHGCFGLVCGRPLDQTIEPLVRACSLDPGAVFNHRLFTGQRFVHAPLHWLPKWEPALASKKRADRPTSRRVINPFHHCVDGALEERDVLVEACDQLISL